MVGIENLGGSLSIKRGALLAAATLCTFFVMMLVSATSHAALSAPQLTAGPAESAYIGTRDVLFSMQNTIGSPYSPAVDEYTPGDLFDYDCSLDGAGFSVCDENFYPNCALTATAAYSCSQSRTYTGLSEGFHQFRTRAAVYWYNAVEDTYNKEFGPYVTHGFTVDTIKPAVSLVGPTTIAAQAVGVSGFYFSASEPATFVCSTDGAAAVNCTSPFFASGLNSGNHALAVSAIDRAGNLGLPAIWQYSLQAQKVATKKKCKVVKVKRHGKVIKKKKCKKYNVKVKA